MGEKKLDGFISIEEASAFLGGMPLQTIRWKVAQREIPAYKVGRGMVFDPKELREYVKRHPVRK